MTNVIEVENLRKSFQVAVKVSRRGGMLRALLGAERRCVSAVKGLGFAIARGERVAFVGLNGAGKSTTLKMLCGILHPSSGEARVAGLVPWQQRRELCYRIGAVFGQRSQLFYHLPAAASFALLGHVYDRDARAHRQRLSELCDAFGVGPYLHVPVRQLSLGQRMRCEIVASLLHDPEVLFLDEPTIGLDVSVKAAIRDLLCEQSERYGRTLLLTSHDTGDMERVCERVIVIHEGKLLLDESLSALRRRYIEKKLVTVQSAEATLSLQMPGVTLLSSDPHRHRLEVDVRVTSVERVLSTLMSQVRVHDLTVEDPPMEQVVQAIYRTAAAVDTTAEAAP